MGCSFKQGCQVSIDERRLNEGAERDTQEEVRWKVFQVRARNSASGEARAGPHLVHSRNRKEVITPRET